MNLTPIKTPIVYADDDLFKLITDNVKNLPEKSILAITSKVVALCEGRVAPIKTGDRQERQKLAKKEADYYIDNNQSQYDILITIKDQVVAVNAGIDESNADGQYVYLPADSYKSAEKIWQFVRQHYGIKQVGILITDSRTFPLKWGVIGTAIAHCGFKALNNKIGDKDLFGHELQMTQVNVAEALSVAAVLEMGETDEAQPFCVIENVSMVDFQDHPPTKQELEELKIDLKDDVYGPFLNSAPWHQSR